MSGFERDRRVRTSYSVGPRLRFQNGISGSRCRETVPFVVQISSCARRGAEKERIPNRLSNTISRRARRAGLRPASPKERRRRPERGSCRRSHGNTLPLAASRVVRQRSPSGGGRSAKRRTVAARQHVENHRNRTITIGEGAAPHRWNAVPFQVPSPHRDDLMGEQVERVPGLRLIQSGLMQARHRRTRPVAAILGDDDAAVGDRSLTERRCAACRSRPRGARSGSRVFSLPTIELEERGDEARICPASTCPSNPRGAPSARGEGAPGLAGRFVQRGREPARRCGGC